MSVLCFSKTLGRSREKHSYFVIASIARPSTLSHSVTDGFKTGIQRCPVSSVFVDKRFRSIDSTMAITACTFSTSLSVAAGLKAGNSRLCGRVSSIVVDKSDGSSREKNVEHIVLSIHRSDPYSCRVTKKPKHASIFSMIRHEHGLSRWTRSPHCTMSTLCSTFFSLDDPTLLPTTTTEIQPQRHEFPVLNPAATEREIENGQAVIAMVESMDRNHVKSRIEESASALSSWRDETTGLARSRILQQLSHLLIRNKKDLAKIMTLESGKPLRESYAEIQYASSYIDFYAGEAIRSTSAGGGSLIPTPFQYEDGKPKGTIMTLQQAVGVTAMITPWNFPLAMLARKVAPALAVGCTTLIKPSDLTPLTAMAFETLSHRAGIPKTVLQVLPVCMEETSAVGMELCINPLIRKISFTGSTQVGKTLMRQGSDSVKRLSLELGGNAPFIVFEDADLDQAVLAAMSSKFRNAGQTCVCADRFIIHESILDAFTAKLKQHMRKINVGPGLVEGTTMGPLISRQAVQRLWDKVRDALHCTETPVQLVLGGSPISQLGPNYFEPTIISNVSTQTKLWTTETFGPVIAITSFCTEDEALELANRETEGLASYICTRDAARIFRFSSR
jgi:succinate-semialdehyde dehydrogenase/glutarate-semialdehyde dehydrogenase